MKYFLLGLLIVLCILLFETNHYLLGLISILVGIVVFVYEGTKYMLDLEWMNRAIIDEKERLRLIECSKTYYFVSNRIKEGIIKKGMTVKEIRDILGNRFPPLYLGEGLSEFGTDICFYGYGHGMPTPKLILRFKKGKLAGWK